MEANTDHRVLGAHVVDNKGTDDGPRHIEQATFVRWVSMIYTQGGTNHFTDLMMTPQPNTMDRASLPPVTLGAGKQSEDRKIAD